MSSILTNNGAMVALQTLKQTNRNMADVQNQISTGKQINSAKDNAATWAISKVMEADVKGFKALSDSLSLGESTVAVARNATETVTELLTEIKGKVTSAQEENVDRAKIQTDIEALRDQITSVVGAAQFNGLNLIDGNAETPVKVTGSLDRAANGTVTAKSIDVAAMDLSQTKHAYGAGAGTVVNGAAVAGDDITSAAGTATVTITKSGAAADGDSYRLAFNGDNIDYVANAGESADDIATGLKRQLQAYFAENEVSGVSVTAKDGVVSIKTDDAAGVGSTVTLVGTETEGTAGGDLAALADIDVTTDQGAAAALANIEVLIQSSIDSAASFGSVEKRIEIQNDFVGKLMDSMKSGIGTLVDADMEETSARLQALQVQQQLGIQSLSMANQAPQSVLSLFR